MQLLWQALVNMFDHDHSAARGRMTARRLIAFRHDSALGNAPAHKLLELVKAGPSANRGKDAPARHFEDYDITFDESAVPQGVTAEVLL